MKTYNVSRPTWSLVTGERTLIFVSNKTVTSVMIHVQLYGKRNGGFVYFNATFCSEPGYNRFAHMTYWYNWLMGPVSTEHNAQAS